MRGCYVCMKEVKPTDLDWSVIRISAEQPGSWYPVTNKYDVCPDCADKFLEGIYAHVRKMSNEEGTNS